MTELKPVFQQTWWEDNLESRMDEFRRWIGDHTAESKVFCRRYIAGKGYRSILDCGCGICTEYHGYRSDGYDIAYKGVDATPKLVALGRSQGIDVAHGYVEALPFADASVDVCYVRHILEHLPRYEEAINEVMRVARQEVVVCWFIKPDDGDDFINYSPADNLYHNRYNSAGIESLVRSHPRFKGLQWIDLNVQECVLTIQLAQG